MANPVVFTPKPVDPHVELMRRLENAPREHAEALLGLFDLLQTSHNNGTLDLVHGLIGGRDIIAGELASAVNTTEGVNAIRNVIALGRLVAALDPDLLYSMSRALDRRGLSPEENEAPSLWAIFRQLRGEDTRRGMGIALEVLAALGNASRSPAID